MPFVQKNEAGNVIATLTCQQYSEDGESLNLEWVDDGENIEIELSPYIKIQKLESQITSRRLRDAILTEAGRQWLDDIESEIEALRGEL